MNRHIFPAGLAQLHAAESGRQWQPSNATEGQAFIEAWCCECQRDRCLREGLNPEEVDPETDTCPIFDASFRGEATEWQIGVDGQPCCTAYIPAGQAVPTSHCEHTQELPLGEGAR
jgi:hypothetical protein